MTSNKLRSLLIFLSPLVFVYLMYAIETPWVRAVIIFAGLAYAVAVSRQRRTEPEPEIEARADTPSPAGAEPADGKLHMHQILADDAVCIWTMDIKSNRVIVDDEFLKITGYSRDEVEDAAWRSWDLFHPDDVEAVKRDFQAYLERRITECDVEFRFRCQDGTYRWIHSRMYGSRDRDDQPARLAGSFTDVTGRVEAEIERDRLFNLSIDLLAVSGFDGFLQQVNPAWVRVLGWSRDDLMGKPIPSFIHEDDQVVAGNAFTRLEDGQPVDALETRFRCRNGTYRWLSWSCFPYPDRQLVFSVVPDTTEKKAAEQKLLDYQDRLRNLSSQLSLVEDRQRRHLAGAIHDGLAQQLFGIRAKVTLLKYPDKIGDTAPEVEEILQILDETMNDARNLSFELFPPVLQEIGLEGALTWLAHQYSQRTGIETDVKVEGEGEELPQDLRAQAYQSVRELLNNVQKHAAATTVHISVNHVENFQTIIVEDNGKGFEIERVHGFGQ